MRSWHLYIILFSLMLPLHGVAQFSRIDTAVVELAKINTGKVGGFAFHNDSLWFLLKSYNTNKYKPKLEANEFYHVRIKFKEWNLYVMDTAEFKIRRKATEYYLPWASPYGFTFNDTLLYYVARKSSSSYTYLTQTGRGALHYKSKNRINSGVHYPFLFEQEKALYFSSLSKDDYAAMNLAKVDSPYNELVVKTMLDSINNPFFNDEAPYFSTDSVFYFSSNRGGSKNGNDLYLINFKENYQVKRMSKSINTKYEEKWFCSETDTSGYFIRQKPSTAILYKYYCWRVPDTKVDSLQSYKVLSVRTDAIISDTLASIKAKEVIDVDNNLTKLFQLNMFELTPDMRDSLIFMAKFLRTEPSKHLLIIGHASPDGPEYINMNLSVNRANSAMKYLIEDELIDSSRISILYGGEYLFTDTIKARRFSMYTLNGPVVPPLIGVYVLKENETADEFLKNFDLSADDIEPITLELKSIVPITPDRIYFPIKGMKVTDKTENVNNIAKRFNIKGEKLIKANRLSGNTIEKNTILYIPQ
jgi:flagellar motor protein MotB